jgi:hypothetical protein
MALLAQSELRRKETIAAQTPKKFMQTTNRAEPLRQDIEQYAYSLYEQRGREPGHELEDWLEAEKRVAEKRIARAGGSRGPSTETGTAAMSEPVASSNKNNAPKGNTPTPPNAPKQASAAAQAQPLPAAQPMSNRAARRANRRDLQASTA